jgi:hypothetical protein
VIDLPRRPESGVHGASAERERTAHAEFLQGRYGDRWVDLPEALGRPLVNLEELLVIGPVAIPPTTPAMQAIVRARQAARASAAIGEIACREAEVLEHALGAPLVDLPIHRLNAVADAVLGLSTAPIAEPAWASPLAAHAADALLDACRDDLLQSAHTHQAVYAQFTNRIWDVPARRLRAGRRPWRPISWCRLRHALAAASRTRTAPRHIAVAADLVIEARSVRDRMETIASLLANHLGAHDHGPVTNVESARDSLAAVRQLQAALGDRLNADRLERLLAADAFKSDAVLEPTRILGTALRAWNADIVRLGGAGQNVMGGMELTQWAARVEAALTVVEDAVIAVGDPADTAEPLRDLVYDLLVRERYSELTGAQPASVKTTDSEAAS